MGVRTHAGATVPEGVTRAPAGNDALSRALSDELADKGFVVSQVDKVVNWALSGSLWGLTFGLACCGV